MNQKVRFAMIGTGQIAQAFAQDASKLNNVEIVAVSARDLQKTQQFAKTYQIKKVYDNYQAMLADPDIDAVYIATFHPTHAPYSIEAMQHGKHVLCEKPIALNRQQVDKVLQTAKENNVLFMEAMTVGFNPVYQQAKQMINDGAIGEIRAVHSFSGKISTKAHKHNPQQAGGALMDMGIYHAFLLIDLLGYPDDLWASKRMNQWGVDGATTFVTQHGNVQAISYCTMDTESLKQAIIMGSKGSICLKEPWTTAKAFSHIPAGGEEILYNDFKELSWLGHEVEAFANDILAGRRENSIMTYKKSQQMIELLDKIREQVDIKFE